MTRAEAVRVLEVREGTPPEHLDACSTDALVAAARADAGQPCADCGALVTWSDDGGWQHVDEASSCFLAHRTEGPR